MAKVKIDKPKKNTQFQPNWLAVLVSIAAIAAALWAFWQLIHVPVAGAPKVLLIVLAVLIAVLVCFMAGMRLILELYSKGVWATPEEQVMAFPGDDLVKDPEGKPLLRVRQARDLDAPLEEVWKHVYQMDPTKGGMYAWSNCERLFGMNVDNAYVLQDMWQQPDSVAPGDFWAWSYGGFGAEVADVVPNKYITWFADSRDPVRTPGASYMLMPGLKYCVWYWTIALSPLDGGKRCRMYSFYDVAYGPHNPFTYAVQKLVIGDGGAMMGRRAMRNIELAARFQRRKSIPLRLQQALLAPCRGDDDRLHEMVAYPDLRWSRDCPRIEAVRAPFTDDPNWPPAPGEQYAPPIAENNARAGWTPQKAVENNRIADEKQERDLVKYGLV